MEYLSKEEIKRAKMCVLNIQDKLGSVASEINTREKPYKHYLQEKIESILWDANVLMNMVNNIGFQIELDENIYNLVTPVLIELENVILKKCSDSVNGWKEDIFSYDDWSSLWNIIDNINSNRCITQEGLDKLVEIENEICVKENNNIEVITQELHKNFIDILNLLSHEMEMVE